MCYLQVKHISGNNAAAKGGDYKDRASSAAILDRRHQKLTSGNSFEGASREIVGTEATQIFTDHQNIFRDWWRSSFRLLKRDSGLSDEASLLLQAPTDSATEVLSKNEVGPAIAKATATFIRAVLPLRCCRSYCWDGRREKPPKLSELVVELYTKSFIPDVEPVWK